MLAKLLKYDLKSMFKVFVPLWLALLAVSIINRFTLNTPGGFDTPQMLTTMLYVFLFAAVMVVALVLIIMRFYNGLLKDEGYLMFTLPVRPWQLVASKAISATIIVVISIVLGIASIGVIALGNFTWADVWRFFDLAIQDITGDIVLTLVLTALLFVAGIIASVTQVYAALSLGHLAPSHRVGWAVVAYIGINLAMTWAMDLLGELAGKLDWHLNWLNTTVQQVNAGLAVALALCLVQIVIFFIVTERILSKRLNLE